MTAIEFYIPGSPVPKQSTRFVRRGGKKAHPDPRIKAWQQTVALEALKARGAARPFDGPVLVQVSFGLGDAPGVSVRVQPVANADIYMTGRPDIDNLVKGILDALNGVLYTDDALVVRLEAEKRRSER